MDKNQIEKLQKKLDNIKKNKLSQEPGLNVIHRHKKYVFAGNKFYCFSFKASHEIKGIKNQLTKTIAGFFNKARQQKVKSELLVEKKFLLDVLKNIDDKRITIKIPFDNSLPVFITGYNDKDQQALLMPLSDISDK